MKCGYFRIFLALKIIVENTKETSFCIFQIRIFLR